ncbi:MAG: hypothetical protein ACK4IT_00020 [Thioalkalivibrionaceae bacterium]
MQPCDKRRRSKIAAASVFGMLTLLGVSWTASSASSDRSPDVMPRPEPTLIAAPTSSSAPLAALDGRGIWVAARLSERFRDAWIIEDEGARQLVEMRGSFADEIAPRLALGEAARWLLEPTRRGWQVLAVEIEGERLEHRRGGAREGRGGDLAPDTAAGSRSGKRWHEHLSDLGFEVLEGPIWTGLHHEAIVTNPFGERVQIHFDADGEVYKERHRFDPWPQDLVDDAIDGSSTKR